MAAPRRLLTLAGAAAGAAGALAIRHRARAPEWLPRPPQLIAHRGGGGLAPENTLAAFRPAVEEWAADMVELDVHASADGQCVVIHDPTADRTTDGTGPVAERTVSELRELDAGYRFSPDGGRTFPYRGRGVRIPTLPEVLEALPDTPMIIEVKSAAAQQPLFETIRRARAEDRVIVGGQFDAIRTQFAQCPGPVSASAEQCMRYYVLHRLRLGRFWAPNVAAVQIPEFWKKRRILTPRLVQDLHSNGLPVQVWTVNEVADMERLVDWGVDGILTDRPDLLSEVLVRKVGRPAPPIARTRQAGGPAAAAAAQGGAVE